jgi:hypothetical protein
MVQGGESRHDRVRPVRPGTAPACGEAAGTARFGVSRTPGLAGSIRALGCRVGRFVAAADLVRLGRV